jgi:hypothetical protein
MMLATAPCSLNLYGRAFVVADRRPGTPRFGRYGVAIAEVNFEASKVSFATPPGCDSVRRLRHQ